MNKTQSSKLASLCKEFDGLERVLAHFVPQVSDVRSLSNVTQLVNVCDRQRLFDFTTFGRNRLVGGPVDDAWQYLTAKPLEQPQTANLKGNYVQSIFACGYGRVLSQITWMDNAHPPLVRDLFANVTADHVNFLVRTAVIQWTRERFTAVLPLVASTDLDILVLKAPPKPGFSQLLEGLSLEKHCRLLARPQWGIRDLYARLGVYESAALAITELERKFYNWQIESSLSEISKTGRHWQHRTLTTAVQGMTIKMTWSEEQKFHGDVCLGQHEHYAIELKNMSTGDTVEFKYFADDSHCKISAIDATIEAAGTIIDTISSHWRQQPDWMNSWFGASA